MEGKEQGRGTSMCGCLLRTPYWGPGLQLRHVPWLGIEPVTLWFAACAQSTELHQPVLFIYFKDFIYLLFREKRTEEEREGEKHQCMRNTSTSCLSCAPSWGPGPHPRHVPCLGVKLTTVQFAGWCSVHWGTPARAMSLYFLKQSCM